MKTWVIPALPKSPNLIRYRHWRVAHEEKKAWDRWILAICGKWAPAPTCLVAVTIIQNRTRKLDPDNLVASVKPILDALVRYGWLKDDSDDWIDLTVEQTQVPRKLQSTKILYELRP